MEYIYAFLFASASTLFFAMSVRSSFKTALVAGVLGGIGYFLYVLFVQTMSAALAVFIATFVVCMLAECAARIIKTPATVISIPTIFPLVPGVSLYETLLVFGRGDNTGGTSMAVQTLLIAGSMSLAVTIATIIAKAVFKKRRLKP